MHYAVFEIETLFLKEAVRQLVHGYDFGEDRLEVMIKHFSRKRVSPVYFFNPHITLAKNYYGNLSSFDTPDFPIVFDRFEWNERR